MSTSTNNSLSSAHPAAKASGGSGAFDPGLLGSLDIRKELRRNHSPADEADADKNGSEAVKDSVSVVARKERDMISKAYTKTEVYVSGLNALRTLQTCGSPAGSLVAKGYRDSKPSLLGLIACKSRLCPLCQLQKSAVRAGRLRETVKGHLDGAGIGEERSVFGAVLTFRHPADCSYLSVGPLAMMREAQASFARLIKREFGPALMWWCGSVEVTFNVTSYSFNPHYNVTVGLSKKWSDVSVSRMLREIWRKALDLALSKLESALVDRSLFDVLIGPVDRDFEEVGVFVGGLRDHTKNGKKDHLMDARQMRVFEVDEDSSWIDYEGKVIDSKKTGKRGAGNDAAKGFTADAWSGESGSSVLKTESKSGVNPYFISSHLGNERVRQMYQKYARFCAGWGFYSFSKIEGTRKPYWSLYYKPKEKPEFVVTLAIKASSNEVVDTSLLAPEADATMIPVNSSDALNVLKFESQERLFELMGRRLEWTRFGPIPHWSARQITYFAGDDDELVVAASVNPKMAFALVSLAKMKLFNGHCNDGSYNRICEALGIFMRYPSAEKIDLEILRLKNIVDDEYLKALEILSTRDPKFKKKDEVARTKALVRRYGLRSKGHPFVVAAV